MEMRLNEMWNGIGNDEHDWVADARVRAASGAIRDGEEIVRTNRLCLVGRLRESYER